MAPYTKEVVEHLRLQRRIFLSLNTVAAVALSILFYLIVHQQHQISKQAQDIQNERARATFASCQEQNQRHDATIRQLQRVLDQSGVPLKVRRSSYRNTILLINALQPRQNCQKRVERFVSGS